MTRRIVIALLVLALAGAVIGGITWAYEAWRGSVLAEGDAAGSARVQKQWDDDKLERERLHREAVADAIRESKKMAEQAARGERHARARAERQLAQNRADADFAAAVAGGLSGDIAALNAHAAAAGVADAAACPGELVRERAASVRARDLLGACSARYGELAAAVDSAWTGITLRLETALGWIGAVKPESP